jgi:hypothetical protein
VSISSQFAVFPPRGAPVSAASLAREMAAVARVTISPPPFPDDAARGNGQPVIVLPGFGAKDFTTARLRAFLAMQGFSARPWPCGANIGPAPNVLLRAERDIAEMAARHGKVALVGISLAAPSRAKSPAVTLAAFRASLRWAAPSGCRWFRHWRRWPRRPHCCGTPMAAPRSRASWKSCRCR